MEFTYLDVEQGSPEWHAARRGKVTASRLSDWLATSKKDGGPLKARLDYERELQFERQFGVTYNNFVTQAMKEGIELENFVREIIQKDNIVGYDIEQVGCWYSDLFVASPDGLIKEQKALVEIKVLRDASFTEVLQNGLPDAHMLQVQGCLLASGMERCFYAAFNTTTKAIKVIEVLPDKEIKEVIYNSMFVPLQVPPYDETDLHFISEVPITTTPQGDNPWTE